MKKRLGAFSVVLFAAVFMVGCAPEVGSVDWCKDLKTKSKGDWSANEATDFAKHCVFK